MSRLIAVVAWGLMLAACSATMPNLNLDFMKSSPQAETLAIKSEPPGAEAKTSLGQSCLTPCQLSVQPGSEFSVTLALRGYQPQTVSVRPEAEGATAPPRLRPNPVHVDLQAVTPKKPIAKKKKPVATPRPAPAVAPAPSASEAAPSATNSLAVAITGSGRRDAGDHSQHRVRHPAVVIDRAVAEYFEVLGLARV
jgi:PEGA domain